MAKDVRRLDIILTDPQAAYKAGENFTGTIFLDLAAETKIKGLRLTIHGLARCSWDNERSKATFKGMTTTSGTSSCKNAEVYLDDTISLPKFTGGIMKQGNYSYSFSHRLPPFLPASFEGQYGKVQYWVKCVCERAWKGSNEITRPITIKGILDLNTEPHMRLPLQEVTEAIFGTCCCRGGHVEAILGVQRQGFVPGETIPFKVSVHNESTGNLKHLRLTMFQIVTFKADKQTRKTNNAIMADYYGNVKKGDNLVWEGELKHIPPVVPSSLGPGCRFIDVKYQLHLLANQGSCGNKVNVILDIKIGTIPLRKTESGEAKTVKAGSRQSITNTSNTLPAPIAPARSKKK